MNEFSPQIFQLAVLPVTPDAAAARELTLAYDPQQKQGRFAYEGQKLLMDYSSTVTRSSRGRHNYEDRSTQHMQEQATIPCVWLGAWLRYGPNWPAELRFTQSAFSYDAATRRWQAHYLRRTIEAVFDDTHYTTIELSLAVDLVHLRGWYTTTEEYEVVD
jgi:hypothetical protein